MVPDEITRVRLTALPMKLHSLRNGWRATFPSCVHTVRNCCNHAVNMCSLKNKCLGAQGCKVFVYTSLL